jgi:hypothetical protein
MPQANWIRFVGDAVVEGVFMPGATEAIQMPVNDEVFFLATTLRTYTGEPIEAVDVRLDCGTVIKKLPCSLFVFMDDSDILYEDAYPTLNI